MAETDKKTLLLITGAGASFDVVNPYVDVNSKFKPILTKDLFNMHASECISDFLKGNPLAASVGFEFNNIISGKHAEESLEKHLYELKNSSKEMDRIHFWTVPIYLYQLFNAISANYLRTGNIGLPSQYAAFITAFNRSSYQQLIWLNLNYDTLADRAIKTLTNSPLDYFNDYLDIKTQDNKIIKYTKPHGSVDWFYRILTDDVCMADIAVGGVPSNINVEKIINKEPQTYSEVQNGSAIFPNHWYPAISVPLGQYKFVYPKHVDLIRPELNKTTDILCIGFSALDKDILDLIKNDMPRIRKMQLVNGSLSVSKDVYARIACHCRNVNISNPFFEKGFGNFMSCRAKEWLG